MRSKVDFARCGASAMTPTDRQGLPVWMRATAGHNRGGAIHETQCRHHMLSPCWADPWCARRKDRAKAPCILSRCTKVILHCRQPHSDRRAASTLQKHANGMNGPKKGWRRSKLRRFDGRDQAVRRGNTSERCGMGGASGYAGPTIRAQPVGAPIAKQISTRRRLRTAVGTAPRDADVPPRDFSYCPFCHVQKGTGDVDQVRQRIREVPEVRPWAILILER